MNVPGEALINITLIGLGRMGRAIATCLLEADTQLTVYNRSHDKMIPLGEQGARMAQSLQEAVAQADIVITCVLDDSAILSITTELLQHLPKSAIHIGTSTIMPQTADQLSLMHQQHGSRYISAALLGAPPAVYAHQLIIMCAGEEKAFQACEPILQAFAETVTYIGDQAHATMVMKICVNYSVVVMFELAAECYVFAEKSGVDLEIIQMTLHRIYGNSPSKAYIDKIKERDFNTVNFDMKGGAKDVSIFQAALTHQGVVPKLADAVKERYISALANGMEDKDWSAIYEVVRKESGLD